MKEDSIVSFTNVSYHYAPHTPQILRDVSFDLPGRSFTAIVGPSGGGKSTILRLVAHLASPTHGSVKNSAKTRMVFQNAALLPWRSVLENVRLGFTGLGLRKADEKKRALAELTELGIRDFAKEYPRDLSGGQRQRVGIARALVSEPELLLLDEPFSALDVETTRKLSEELLDIYMRHHITILMVSHSIEDAVMLADEVLVCADHHLKRTVKIDLPRPRKLSDPHVHELVAKIRAAIQDA